MNDIGGGMTYEFGSKESQVKIWMFCVFFC